MATFHTGFSSLGSDYVVDLERGAEYEFDFVELSMNGYPPTELSTDADRIRTLADDHDVDLIVHLPHGSEDAMVGSSDDETRAASIQQFQSAIEAAGDIGAQKAVLHVDTSDELLLTETGRFDDLCAAVDDLLTVAKRENVELCVENMVSRGRVRVTPRDTVRIADRTGASITFDTGHARTVGYETADMASFLQAHADAVSHLHLNDTRKPADEHLPFGAGTIGFESLFEVLPASWEGTLTLEIGTQNYEYIEFSHRQLTEVLDTVE